MLLKHYTDTQISVALRNLISDYLAADTPGERVATLNALWNTMYEDEIGKLTVDGLNLTKASIWHDGERYALIVATRDWKTGYAYVGGRRMKVLYKRYGNFWLTESEMKRRQVTQEWLDEPAPSQKEAEGETNAERD